MKKLMSFITIMVIIVSSIIPVSAIGYGEELKNQPEKKYIQTFPDVPESYWAFNYISKLVDSKVVSGYPDGLFRPNEMVTRAEFAKIISSAAGINVAAVNRTSFIDVYPDDWYSPYIEATKSYTVSFKDPSGRPIYKPNIYATREDVAVALVKVKGYSVDVADVGTIQTMFKDFDGISQSAKKYIAVGVSRGLISGYSDGTFRPQDTITRAETATLLWRAYNYGNDNKVVDGGGNGNQMPQSSINNPPSSSQQSVQVPAPKKFSIYTLFGGNGNSIKDGAVNSASFSNISSIIVNGRNDIVFMDGSKIRQYNGSSVNTIYDTNKDFKMAIDQYNLFVFRPGALAYNPNKDTTYVVGNNYVNADLNTPADSSVLYEIGNSVSASVYSQGKSYDMRTVSVSFMNDGSLIGTSYMGTMYKMKPGAGVYDYAVNANNFGDSSALMYYNNTLYRLTPNGNLYRYDISADKFELIQPGLNRLKLIDINKATSYNGKFYFTQGNSVYEMGIDGSTSVFVDSSNINVTDDLPFTNIDRIVFDKTGSLVFVDNTHNVVRIVKSNF